MRFNKTEGNFAVNKKTVVEADIERLEKEGLKVGETVLTVTRSDKDKLS